MGVAWNQKAEEVAGALARLQKTGAFVRPRKMEAFVRLQEAEPLARLQIALTSERRLLWWSASTGVRAAAVAST